MAVGDIGVLPVLMASAVGSQARQEQEIVKPGFKPGKLCTAAGVMKVLSLS